MMENSLNIHNIDIQDFIKTLDKCKGDVFLETDEGDCLNLKSKLCQMMGLANILNGVMVSDARIRCADPDDETLLFRLNLYHEVPDEDDKK